MRTCVTVTLSILQYFIYGYCNKLSAHYTINPGLTSLGGSLHCFIHVTELTSAAKYDDQSGSCEILGDSWQTNPTFESGYKYLWINSYEEPFEKTYNLVSPLPTNFQHGSSFEVVFRTGEVAWNWIVINVRSPQTSTTVIHINFRPDENRTVLDSKSGSHWVDDIFLPVPITSPHTQYTVKIFYMPTVWEIYVDDVFFYNFTNRHSFDGVGNVVYESTDAYIEKIVYYPPS